MLYIQEFETGNREDRPNKCFGKPFPFHSIPPVHCHPKRHRHELCAVSQFLPIPHNFYFFPLPKKILLAGSSTFIYNTSETYLSRRQLGPSSAALSAIKQFIADFPWCQAGSRAQSCSPSRCSCLGFQTDLAAHACQIP
jgi:hypothetical protein